jgi:hypothetical protein
LHEEVLEGAKIRKSFLRKYVQSKNIQNDLKFRIFLIPRKNQP